MDTREQIAMILQNGDIDDIGVMLEKFQAGYTEVCSGQHKVSCSENT